MYWTGSRIGLGLAGPEEGGSGMGPGNGKGGHGTQSL